MYGYDDDDDDDDVCDVFGWEKAVHSKERAFGR